MKPLLILSVAILLATSCKPQKPWSPYDNGTDGAALSTSTPPRSSMDRVNADIGDLEQAVFVSGKIGDDSKGPNVAVADMVDRNKNITKSEVTLSPPYPERLWAEYEVKCTRNFIGTIGVLRARIMVDDKAAGSFSLVLGSSAVKNGVSVKVDLLKPFGGNLPETFLAKVEGDFYLLPEGTDENQVNADTATSNIYSNALYGTMFRVVCLKTASPAAQLTAPAATENGETAAVAQSPSPAPSDSNDAAPSEATPADASEPADDSVPVPTQ